MRGRYALRYDEPQGKGKIDQSVGRSAVSQSASQSIGGIFDEIQRQAGRVDRCCGPHPGWVSAAITSLPGRSLSRQQPLPVAVVHSPSQPFPEVQTSPCRPPQPRLHSSPTAIGQPPPLSHAITGCIASSFPRWIKTSGIACFASPQPPVSHACRANVVFDSHAALPP